MNLAVIPARGGSKRIPHKNINTFCGKPIIAWSIEAALKSECFDAVIVSTDCEDIAEIAREYGAEVPFLRPAFLSGDHTETIPVISHAIDWWAGHFEMPELVCCIYATAPFITSDDICLGKEILIKEGCDYAFTVTSFPFPIQRAFNISSESRIKMLYPKFFNTRSQDLEQAFHDAGQFYWGKADAWMAKKKLFSNKAAPIILPAYRVQDIDTPEDWIRAEKMFVAL
jgi:pseudaminic acid cytidylyltransferase|tara:strand:+ start:418 stop:1098 length:681 start_codon:yes stop_codon:yes gene_type:complete